MPSIGRWGQLLLTGSLLVSACGDDDPGETNGATGDSGVSADAGMPQDTGAKVDGGAAPDSGLADTGSTDVGANDSGMTGSQLALVVDVRDLDFEIFGSMATASYAAARAPESLPAAGCVRFTADSRPDIPSFGDLAFTGLEETQFFCLNISAGLSEYRCLGNPGGPPPISGSTVETGPWLSDAEVSVQVSGGTDLGPVFAALRRPTSGVELLGPTVLEGDGSLDLTVSWTPLGDLDVLVELEVQLADQTLALVTCQPTQDGSITVPSSLLGGRPIRLSLARYRSVDVSDSQQRNLRFRIMRGTMLTRF